MPDPKANIVWLQTDHHIFEHHRSQPGPGPDLPVYERIAREGAEFWNAYTVCPLCQPARASMLTGQYPHGHGMTHNAIQPTSRIDFEPGTRLFNAPLQEAGYRCGFFGKSHVGEERHAVDYGFEGFSQTKYGHPYKSERYAAYLEQKGLPMVEALVEWCWNRPELVGTKMDMGAFPYGCPAISGVFNGPPESHEAYFVAHEAVKWMEEVVKGGEPFCLRVDAWGPHWPYHVCAPFANTVNPRSIPVYPSFAFDLSGRPQMHRDFLESCHRRNQTRTWEEWSLVLARAYEHATLVDSAFKTVLDALDRLGIAENTLVLYTSDHGDILASNGGMFDKGAVMSEETMRIPMAMRWPGKIPAGIRPNGFGTNMDFVPTALDAAGVPLLSQTDGVSLLPTAMDPRQNRGRETVMLQSYGHPELHFQRAVRWQNLKYVAHLDDLDELYDLEKDPFEMKNLIDDPGATDALGTMRGHLHRLMEEHGDNGEMAQRLIAQTGEG